MSYTIEHRGRIVINKRGRKDFYRYRKPRLAPLSFNLCRALDEHGNVYRRSLNTCDLDEYKPK